MRSRRIALAALFMLLGFGISSVLLEAAQEASWLLVLPAFVLVGVGVAIASGRLDWGERRWVVAAPPPPAVPQHPFRGALPALPPRNRLSGRRAATALSVALGAIAVGIPVLLHRAVWVELEAVLLGWWAVWMIVLTTIAGRDLETVDDWTFALRVPWRRPGPPTAPRRKRSRLSDVLGAFTDLDAIVVVAAVVFVVVAAFSGAWFVVEMLAPALFFVAYSALFAALRRIRTDESHAALASIKWATAYVGPLALAVWLVHVV